jgi:transcriptional regulator with XRE-family HTH domain
VSALSDLLAAHSEGRSARSIARDARERGHTLNHDTAARYLRGDHGKPDEATLVALADVLDVSLTKLRAAAGLPFELTEPYVPPAEASRLSRRQRLAVDEIIRAMLDPGQAAVGDELAERRGSARKRAARHGDPESGRS